MVTTSNSLSCPLILLRWAGLESSLLLHRRRDRRPWALLTQDHQLGGVGTGIQTQKRLTTEPLPKQARVSGGLKEPGSLLLAPWAAPDPRSRRMHWQVPLGMAGSWEAAFHYWERLLSRPKGAWPGLAARAESSQPSAVLADTAKGLNADGLCLRKAS